MCRTTSTKSSKINKQQTIIRVRCYSIISSYRKAPRVIPTQTALSRSSFKEIPSSPTISNHHLSNRNDKMPSTTRLITSIGIITLLHSAYSCLHYRSILTTTNIDILDLGTNAKLDPSKPPQDVIIECMLGFILCLIGQIIGKGDFLPVTGEGRKEVKAPAHVGRDFDLFHTREEILSDARNRKGANFEKWEDKE